MSCYKINCCHTIFNINIQNPYAKIFTPVLPGPGQISVSRNLTDAMSADVRPGPRRTDIKVHIMLLTLYLSLLIWPVHFD